MTRPDDKFQELREKARQLLTSGQYAANDSLRTLSHDVEELIHELQTYDVELNLQNKQLRHSENQLVNALKRFELIFGALPMASLVIDESGIVVDANDFAAKMFNFRDKSLIQNHSLLRLVSHHDRNQLYNSIHQLATDTTVQIGPIAISHDEKQLMDFYLVILPAEYHTEKRILITIAERTRHYARLRKLQLLQTLVNRAESRIFAFDQNNRCLFVNNEELELIGLSREQVLGSRRDRWMKQHDALNCEHQDALVYTARQSYLYEEKLPGHNNHHRYYMTHKFPLIDENGEVFGVGSISTETTQTREQRERLDLAMSAYTMGKEAIMITDADNRIIMTNQAFTKISGFKEDEAIGKNPSLLASNRHDSSFYRDMWADLGQRGYWEGEIWNRRKNGDVFPVWLMISRITGSSGEVTNYIGVFSDITKRKLAEEEIHNLAFYDTLTGLPNRYLLSDRVNQLVLECERNNRGFYLLFFDLDEFKLINDVHGHAAGDLVLREVSKRVSLLTRDADTLCRLGGDEFVLVIKDIEVENVRRRVTDMIGAINQDISFEQQILTTSASFGIASYPSDGKSFDQLMQNADTAMYEAKSHGRDRFEFFNADMSNRARQQFDIEYELKNAVMGNELALVFQPIYDLRTSRIVAAEALLRWHSAKLGEISPAVFIPLAEKSGIIHEIGEWVLEQAAKGTHDINRLYPDFTIAVNISARQLESGNFIEKVREIIETQTINAGNLELEITETMIMDRPDWAISILKNLKSLGVKLSLDDFGTGYSSMSYLRWMPIDLIKLDQSFVMGINSDESNQKISQSIISLAHNLGMQSIAEGVESRDVMNFLTQNQCDYAQGYHISRPVPLDKLIALLTSDSSV